VADKLQKLQSFEKSSAASIERPSTVPPPEISVNGGIPFASSASC
jgi:hypothetical protein